MNWAALKHQKDSCSSINKKTIQGIHLPLHESIHSVIFEVWLSDIFYCFASKRIPSRHQHMYVCILKVRMPLVSVLHSLKCFYIYFSYGLISLLIFTSCSLVALAQLRKSRWVCFCCWWEWMFGLSQSAISPSWQMKGVCVNMEAFQSQSTTTLWNVLWHRLWE